MQNKASFMPFSILVMFNISLRAKSFNLTVLVSARGA